MVTYPRSGVKSVRYHPPAMALYAGTSGFSYREWRPGFYPEGTKPAAFLAHYASVLNSVEINNTFYRSPSEKLLAGWVDKTPPSFRFTLKAPQRITHRQRLRDVDDALSTFLSAARALGERLGMILFQCPPNLPFDAELYKGFLAALPGEPFRFAMEFRHPSWNTPEVHDMMRANNIAWCVAETEGEGPVIRTARAFAYLRLRKDEYTDAELDRWAHEARTLLDDGADVYAYFKHEDAARAPAYARALAERVSG